MKYITKKQKDQLSIAIRGKFYSALSLCEEKFMTAHFERFKSYRTTLETMFLPIGDRYTFTETENNFIFNCYLNKTPIYSIKESLPYAQTWLRQNHLKFNSLCCLRQFIENTKNKHQNPGSNFVVENSNDWTEGGKDRWGYKEWLRRDGENFDLWLGPLGEQ